MRDAGGEELLRHQLNSYHRLVLGWLFHGRSNHSAVLSTRDLVLRSSLILQDLQVRDALSDHFGSTSYPQTSSSRRGSGRSDSTPKFGICWDLTLKYRFDDSATVGYECHVQMNGLNVPYGFHYASPHSDSVVTPGTLRTLFALFACVRSAQGILLTGAPGVGKAHLAFQTSRILGRQCFSTTTKAPTAIAHVLMLLRGALHAGGTFCLRIAPSEAARVVEIVRVVAATLERIEVRSTGRAHLTAWIVDAPN